MDLDFTPITDSRGILVDGLRMTVQLTLLAFLLGAVAGLLLAMARMSKRAPLRLAASGFINFILATPVIVHLFVVYYGLPLLLGFNPPGFEVLVLVLAINQSVVMAENYRAGLQAVPTGLRDASRVLGLSETQRYRLIDIPLAIRYTIPPMTSSIVNLIKDTSIATFIGIADITDVGRKIALESFRPIEVFTAIAVGYFIITYPVVLLSDYLERRLRSPLLRS